MNYSIITPTRNEGKYIEETIKSVISQEILPLEWLIMNDESTDDTSDIVKGYLQKFPFIKYINLSGFRNELKNRGGRVAAIINYADSLRTQPADVIAKIDADTSFEKTFFINVLRQFENDPSLGVASGRLVENGIPEDMGDRINGRGAALIIRYDCFLRIGKFIESKTRGEDNIAYVSARALGWKTQTFDYRFNHLKPIGFINSRLKNHFETGYYKGSIPYWFPFFLFTVIRDVFKKPYLVGAVVILYGYCLSALLAPYRPFPAFATRQLRLEQKNQFRRILGISRQPR